MSTITSSLPLHSITSSERTITPLPFHSTANQHSTSSSSNHSETLPPEYNSITQTPRQDTTNLPQVGPEAQATRNREKQALRDAWAQQDLPRVVAFPNTPSVPSSVYHSSSPSSTTVPGIPNGPTGSHSSVDQATARGVLPDGMDVQEALAKCEDPTLGWSMQFWVTIADPVTQHVFFACPASGQCSWDPPVGAFAVPRSPDGEWFEFADLTRGGRSYYFNTMSGKTQWTRPTGGAFIIPLGLIQKNSLGPRPHQRSATSNPSHLSPNVPSPDSHGATVSPGPSTPRSRGPRPPPSPRTTPGGSGSHHSDRQTSSPPLLTPTMTFPEAEPAGHTPPLAFSAIMEQQSSSDMSNTSNKLPRTPLSVVEERSDHDTDLSDQSSPRLYAGGWWDRRRNKISIVTSPKKLAKMRATPETVAEEGQGGMSPFTPPSSMPDRVHASGTVAAPVLPVTEPTSPIFVENIVRTKRMSTGLHPLLPTSISSEIQNFRAEDFASKYFATKRSGMLRSRVPLARIMEWQKQPISSPLLVLSKSLAKDALTTFKVIQHVMGERDRPVENARPTSSSTFDSKTARHGEPGRMSEEKVVTLEEIRWVIQLAVSNVEMRDEVYSQLIKQLTSNPETEATVLGYQLFCVLVHAFPPSKHFEVFVKAFLQKEGIQGTDGISVMARYCLTRLDAISAKGMRSKVLTLGEIEHASDAAFHPSVYGESLTRVMDLQARSYPSLKVPVILPFLADGILALGGLKAEGIFRVPGDGDAVSELKSRMDRGHYQLTGIDDPHVAASLFKLWLRELEEPVIPTRLYNAALTASKSTAETLHFISRLPTLHRRVLLFVISFAQLFLADNVVEMTKMNAQNLALVLAPNILRTTSEHLVTVYTNTSFESKFILQLLEHLHPADVDAEYVPVHGQAIN